MSERERAKQIIDSLPDSKLIFVIDMLNSVKGLLTDEIEPDEIPNAETIDAMRELESGGGEVFDKTDKLFESWNNL